MRQNKQSYQAFTLIETLVTVSLLLIITGFGLASYNNFHQEQLLKQAAEEVKTVLREAQNKALAGEKDSACGNKSLDYWQFEIADNTITKYKINGQCGDLEFGKKEFQLPEGLIFFITTIPLSIKFKPLGYGIDRNVTEFAISNLSNNKRITVSIRPGGLIWVSDIY